MNFLLALDWMKAQAPSSFALTALYSLYLLSSAVADIGANAQLWGCMPARGCPSKMPLHMPVVSYLRVCGGHHCTSSPPLRKRSRLLSMLETKTAITVLSTRGTQPLSWTWGSCSMTRAPSTTTSPTGTLLGWLIWRTWTLQPPPSLTASVGICTALCLSPVWAMRGCMLSRYSAGSGSCECASGETFTGPGDRGTCIEQLSGCPPDTPSHQPPLTRPLNRHLFQLLSPLRSLPMSLLLTHPMNLPLL